MEGRRCAYVRKPKGKRQLGKLGVNGRQILNWIFFNFNLF
jgi:hypothetical protein